MYNVSSSRHLRAGFGDYCQILSRTLFDDVEAALLDCLGVHQFAADGHGAGARLQELTRGFKVDAASRDHLDMREWPAQSFDVFCATHVPAGKDLDDVCSGLPGGHHFTRPERSGAHSPPSTPH